MTDSLMDKVRGMSIAAIVIAVVLGVAVGYQKYTEPPMLAGNVPQLQPPAPKPKPRPEEPRFSPAISGLQFARSAGENGALSNPSRAEWNAFSATSQPVSLIGDDREMHLASGVVDAENVFGAMVRHRWSVLIARDGAEYVPLRITIGGKTVYESD